MHRASCHRFFQHSSTLVLYLTGTYPTGPFQSASQPSKNTLCSQPACNQSHSDTLWVVFLKCNSFFSFFFPSSKSNGGGETELHRSGLIPDRQKNTNKINLCQLPPGAGMKEHNGTLPKQGRGREGEREGEAA